MSRQPSGTVTMVFTDIEGSTLLLRELGEEAYRAALTEHRKAVRHAFARYDGYEVDYEGDAFFFAFQRATDAVAAVQEAMASLAAGPIRIRVGVHTGEPALDPPKYVGMDVHKAARIMSAGHGGQVLLSKVTRELLDAEVTDLGEHRLKDFSEPVSIYQLGDERFPPLKTISNTNLPRPASSFVGREREVGEVLARIRDGARLLTLSGPGGSGKTRLALEAATALVPEFKAGVFWVGLATLRDPMLVSETIAQTLGAKDGLAEHIAERQLLLLLDNFEQVIEAAPTVAGLVSACPNLTVLVTSRELLRVQGEVEYRVPPLADPEAVSLFCERAQLAATDEIAELCRRLDNLPLAVELAAARANALSPSQIVARLAQRLDLLKGGRDSDPRQQTLRATIQWSYDLLSQPEQRLFGRLAVFAGGCTLEDAEAVADADLDTLQSLVDKSLLRFSNERYWMLETIREYADDRLDASGQQTELRRELMTRMLARFAELPREPSTWLPVLEAERDNLRAAMSTALELDDSTPALTLAAAYGTLCQFLGPMSEGRRWLDAALARGDEGAPAARCKALFTVGAVASRQRDFDYADACGEQALRLAKRMGDREAIARSLFFLGVEAGLRNELDRAESLLREALAVVSEVGNEREEIRIRGMIAWLPIARQDYASARSALTDALALSRKVGDQWGIVLNAGNLGFVFAREGRFEQALELFRESIPLAHDARGVDGLAHGLTDLAGAAVGLGKHAEAALLLGGAEALFEHTEAVADWVTHEWHEETVTRLRHELDAAELADLWERGRKMTLDELVAYALEFIESGDRTAKPVEPNKRGRENRARVQDQSATQEGVK
jgi:predicted ATPase